MANSRKDRGYARSGIGFRIDSVLNNFSGWLRSGPVESIFIKKQDFLPEGTGGSSSESAIIHPGGGYAGEPTGLLLAITKVA